jgi:RHS repeat-associated protein
VAQYSYNNANELTGQSGNVTYTYDNNGNLLTKTVGTSVTSYGWDFENRLTSVILPGTGGTVTFKYDPFCRRIEKVYTHSGATTTSIYAYDGDNQVEEVDASGNVVARYVQGLGIDELRFRAPTGRGHRSPEIGPLAILRSGVTSYYHADGLGSVNALSQINRSYDEIYKYDSFGVRLSFDGTVTNPFQYTARERDDETSLYYYRARYYDTSVGRFVSEDPIRFSGGADFYTYVDNDPPNFSDPNGLKKVCCRRVISTLYTECHCWIILSNGETLGFYRFGAILQKIRNHSDDRPTPRGSSCTDVPVSGCKEKEILREFYKQPESDYYTQNSTSNTYISVILKVIPYKLPACAGGARK